MTIIVKDDPYIWAENKEWQGDDMQWYWVQEWYFSLFGRVYGPFATAQEAGEARDGMISDSYQDDAPPARVICPDCGADIPNDGACWYCENKPQLDARSSTNEPVQAD